MGNNIRDQSSARRDAACRVSGVAIDPAIFQARTQRANASNPLWSKNAASYCSFGKKRRKGVPARYSRRSSRRSGSPSSQWFIRRWPLYPSSLNSTGARFSPLTATHQFFQLGDRLRGRKAYTRMHNYFQITDLCGPLTEMSFSEGAKHQLGDAIDLFNYTNPLLLVIVSTQLLAFEQPLGADANCKDTRADHPWFHERPHWSKRTSPRRL